MHILLVEDSELVTDALRILLESTGRRVSIAATVAAARVEIESDPPDVILLDLTLPDGSGLDVARFARQRIPAAVILAMTGHDDPAVDAACRAAGCREVLVKPVSNRLLVDTLDALPPPQHG